MQSITGWKPTDEDSKVEPAVILPTTEQLDFMRSREWECAEMEGLRMSNEQIMTRSGYGRSRLSAL